MQIISNSQDHNIVIWLPAKNNYVCVGIQIKRI